MNIHDEARELVRASRGVMTMRQAYQELSRRANLSKRRRRYGVAAVMAGGFEEVENPARPYWWQRESQ